MAIGKKKEKKVVKKEEEVVVEAAPEVVEEVVEAAPVESKELGPRTLRAMSNGSSAKKIAALKAAGA